MYVGTPSWDVGPGTVTGEPEVLADSIRDVAAMGVTHMGLRFRSRSCDELIDQIAAFSRDVVPLV